jgi:hypothetical protein
MVDPENVKIPGLFIYLLSILFPIFIAGSVPASDIYYERMNITAKNQKMPGSPGRKIK